MPTLTEFSSFFVLGLAAGAVYALSGTGLVVLYRTTGVVNFAFGAIGMVSAFVAWSLLQTSWCPNALAYLGAFGVAIAISLIYGMVVAPPFAQRDSVTKSVGTLGFALLLVGIVFVTWDTAKVRKLDLGVEDWKLDIGKIRLNGLNVISIVLAAIVVASVTVLLNRTRLGTAMRAVANDREVAALAGIPVRRIDLVAWLGAGAICGLVGIINAALVNFDVNTLTFALLVPSLAAATIGRLSSLWITMLGGFLIGVMSRVAKSFSGDLQFVSDYSEIAPFALAGAVILWLGRHRTVVLSGRAMR